VKIVLVYIAVTRGPITDEYCSRFIATYHEYPPELEHDTLVCCNGGPLRTELAILFHSLNAGFFPRENDPGWDISAYIDAARGPAAYADLMLCMGESCHFHAPGWMKRLAEAYAVNGPGMYGLFSSNLVRPHLNTSAFAVSPGLLAEYGKKPDGRKGRYEFEHGEQSFWKWVNAKGKPVRLVTWDGEWPPSQWRQPHNILWRGNQRNCLVWCNHTERWASSKNNIKDRWSRGADRKFK
jgi:hypothetical protein